MSRNGFHKLAAATAVALAALGASATAAQAGTYKVYSCKTPTGAVAPTDGWTSSEATGGASTVTNDCAVGGPMAASLLGSSDQAAGWHAEWHFEAPDGLSIRGFDAWRSMSTTSAPDVNASAVTYVSWPDLATASIRDLCDSSTGCNAKGLHATWSSPANFYGAPTVSGARSLYFAAACSGSLGAKCLSRGSATAMSDIRLHAAEIELEDAYPPTPHSRSGDLTSTSVHKGLESISFTAGDVGSGVYRAIIEVKRAGEAAFAPLVTDIPSRNGGKCADAGAEGTDPYEFLYAVPCEPWVSTQLELDTTQLPDGVHELRVRVEDASGNSANVHGPVAFEVDNVPPPGVADPDGSGPLDGMPSIAGEPVVGNTLVGDRGSWSGEGLSYSLQWLRCASATDVGDCVAMDGATGTQYLLTSGDASRFIRLRVTASNDQGSATATSPAKGPVTSATGGGDQTSGDGSSDGGAGAALGTPNNGTNASNRAVVTVTSKRRRKIAFGRRIVAVARLQDETGRPITGAQVAVLERMSVPGAEWRQAGSPVVTDAEGRLRWRVPAKYSRTIRFAYKANLQNAGFQSTSDLSLTVRSKTTIAASKRFLHNGQKLRLSGRLLSRPVPKGGVLLNLQARVGKRWVTFETARAKRSGRWAIGYRFRSTRGLQTYSFRARVRKDTGFPYGVSRSRTVKVRVAG